MNTLMQQQSTHVGLTRNVRILWLVICPFFGLLLGAFLPLIASYAMTLPWIPFRGPVSLIASFQQAWVALILAIIGLVAGLLFALYAINECLDITVSHTEVHLKKGESSQTIARKDIDTVYLDGKNLVIFDKSGLERARDLYEATPEQVANAFKRYGYPWSDGDPYKDQYRRWVEDTPDVPPAVNAVFKAREKALQKKDEKDALDLRRELNKLGFVVRDEENKQYWRLKKQIHEY